jgi:protein gp37
MNKTKIEWCDYTVNPVKGLCPMACSYCYARRMYKRYKWDETIQYWPESIMESSFLTKPSRIFVGSTMELFGDWVKDYMMKEILALCAERSEFGHQYIFLTKQPQNLIKWSPFPENCWIGVSATNQEQYYDGVSNIGRIEAKVKFVSFEPLLEQINGGECAEEFRLDSIDEFDWIIIGQQTPVSIKTAPKIEWIKEIVDAADHAGIPVFLKENLIPVFWVNGVKDHVYFPAWATAMGEYRQEFPAVI